MNIAIFASGNGSNFQAIVDAIKKGALKAQVACLVCDNPKAYCLERAKRAGVKTLIAHDEEEILEALERERVGLVVLAGYMRLLSSRFVAQYRNRLLNIHPALLPSFKGAHGIKDAFNYGVKVTGVTVHFVDEKMDSGPIILQEAVPIREDDTEESLEARIHEVERRLYPEAIRLFIEGRLRVEGRRVRALPGKSALA